MKPEEINIDNLGSGRCDGELPGRPKAETRDGLKTLPYTNRM